MAFSTFINYSRKLFEFFRVTFRHTLGEQPQEGVPRKKLLQKLQKKREKSGKLIMRKIPNSFCEVDY